MELVGRAFIQVGPNAVTWREIKLREQDRKYLKDNFQAISYRTSKWQIITKRKLRFNWNRLENMSNKLEYELPRGRSRHN